MTTPSEVVGFVGLGTMGAPMAGHLLAAGGRLAIFDREPKALVPFEGRAQIATSPAELGEIADIVFACMTSDDSYRDVILAGVGTGRRVKTYVHTGSNSAALLEEIGARLGAAGIATLDAPITGGVEGAKSATLTSIVAGPPDILSRTQHLIGRYSRKIIVVSDRIGLAQTTKLINNMVNAANLAAACEALVVGQKAGVDLAALIEVLNNGTGRNNATVTTIPQQILTRKFSQGGNFESYVAVLGEFLKEAERHNALTSVSAAVREVFAMTLRVQGADADVTDVIKPMERAAKLNQP